MIHAPMMAQLSPGRYGPVRDQARSHAAREAQPGCHPGRTGWAVAVEDLRLVGVPGGGGAVGVQDQGPAPPVDHDLVVEPAE